MCRGHADITQFTLLLPLLTVELGRINGAHFGFQSCAGNSWQCNCDHTWMCAALVTTLLCVWLWMCGVHGPEVPRKHPPQVQRTAGVLQEASGAGSDGSPGVVRMMAWVPFFLCVPHTCGPSWPQCWLGRDTSDDCGLFSAAQPPCLHCCCRTNEKDSRLWLGKLNKWDGKFHCLIRNPIEVYRTDTKFTNAVESLLICV